MGFRFRRSVKILPGVRWNFSKSGTSWSFGRRGYTVNVCGGKVRRTISIPGTGLSYTAQSRASSTGRLSQPISPVGSEVSKWLYGTSGTAIDPARFGISSQPVSESAAKKLLVVLGLLSLLIGMILFAIGAEGSAVAIAIGAVLLIVGGMQPSKTTLEVRELARCETLAKQELVARRERFTTRARESRADASSIRSLLAFQAELGLTDDEIGTEVVRGYREILDFHAWEATLGGHLHTLAGHEAIVGAESCFFVGEGLYDRRGPNDHNGVLYLTAERLLFHAPEGVTAAPWAKVMSVGLDGKTVRIQRRDRQTPYLFVMYSLSDALKADLIARNILASQRSSAETESKSMKGSE